MHPLLALTCPTSNQFPPSLYNCLTDSKGQVNLSLNSITYLIINLIHIAITLAGVLAVCFIVYGGIKYVMSEGDPAKVANAKSTLVNSLVGIVIASLAYVVVGFVANLF